MTTSYFLKQNAYIEPLVNQWYGWPLLIPPQTLSMISANWHCKIMESYIQSPEMHANAVKNPKMLGGPFIDLAGKHVDRIQDLLRRTRSQNEHLFQLAQAIESLETLLTNEATGFSLAPLYEKIPADLKGYVELFYDLDNHPNYRFIERLMYHSPFFSNNPQTIALSRVDRDERAFALSTPRFADETHLHYPMAYSHDAIDRLFSMRDEAQPLEYVEEFIPEDPGDKTFFTSLFTQQPPLHGGRDRDQLGDRVRIKYCGHACLLMESEEVSILTDPLLAYDIPDKNIPRYTYQDMPKTIDYAILTHIHQDHLMFETLLQLRHKIKHIVVPRASSGALQDPSPKLLLEQTGFKNIIELDDLETCEVPGGQITGIPFFGEHGDLNIRSKLAYRVTLKGKTAVFVADSNNIAPQAYDHIGRILGPTDAVFIGMECDGAPMSWLYGPLLTKPLARKMDQTRRFDGSDSQRAMAMIRSLGAGHVYVYAMGQEPWLTFVSSIKYTEQSRPMVESAKLIQTCLEQGIAAERPYGRTNLFL